MVDLTPQEGPLVVSQAPTPRVSAGEIAQPYSELAHALDQLGEATGSVAENFAQRAGYNAVTRDADGNIQVEKLPIIGPASQAYSRAVKIAALAQGEGDAKRADIALRQQYRDDPQGYLAAADAFKAKTMQQYGEAAGPAVGIAMGRAIDSATTYTYRSLLSEKERLDLQRADASMSAGIDSARNDAVALARGGDTSSEAFRAAVDKVHALTAERVNNPRLAYPQDKANYDLQQFDGELKANGFLYHVDQIYQNAPSKEQAARTALDAAKTILTDPDVKLTEPQRNAYYHKAVAEVRASEALRRQDVAEARSAAYELSLAAAAGIPIKPEDVNRVIDGFNKAGAPGDAARVAALYARKPLNDSFGLQPLDQQVQQLNALHGMARWQGAYQFFINKGYSPAQASGIVGGLRGETENLNPAQIHDGGIGLGISGWNGPRLAALRQFAAERGTSVTDLPTQLEFLDKELNSTEATAGAKLRAATTPEQAAQAMLGFFRPKDFDVPGAHPERAAYARAAFNQFTGGAPVAEQNPATALWLQANRSRTTSKIAEAAWKTMLQDYNTKGVVPNDRAVATLVDAARATDDHPLLETIGTTLNRINIAQQQATVPLPEQHADIARLTAAASTGELSPGQAAVLGDLQRRYTAITTGLEKNPVATAAQNFPDKVKQPPPLDFSNPLNLAAGMKARGDIARFAAQNWQTGPLAALDQAELTQVKGALEGPDIPAKAAVFQALSVLPDDVRNATLHKLAQAGGPSMAVAVAAGSMLRTAPDVAQSILRGQMAEKTDKAYWPSAASDKTAATEALNKNMPPAAFGLQGATDPQGAYATATGMVKARYADLSAQAGDVSGKLDEGRLKQAVTDVTGGILNHNGAPLIAPVRGMPQRDFDRALGSVSDNDLAGVTTLNGAPVTSDYLRGRAQLESIGQGRYLVRLGNDPARPVYAYQGANTEMPQKFVLDLRGRQPTGPDPIARSRRKPSR